MSTQPQPGRKQPGYVEKPGEPGSPCGLPLLESRVYPA
jgi:hypothetical protein